MAIRTATVSDIPQIHEISAYYVRGSIATLEETTPPVKSIVSILTTANAQDLPFLVVVDIPTESVEGYAYVGNFSERSGYWPSVEDSIYVHPDHCGRGIGKKLLEEVLKRLRHSNVKTQVLAKMSIKPQQKPEELPSYLLHAKLGFRVVGRLERVGIKFGEKLDVLIMQVGL